MIDWLKGGGKRYYTVALLSAFVVFAPYLSSDNYQLKVITFVGVNVILAVGLCLLLGYAGQISLGHAAFYGIGAYTSAILTARFGFSVLSALALAAISVGVIALLIGMPTLKLRGHYLAMATLGFGEIMHVLFIELEELTGGPSGVTGIPNPQLSRFSIESATEFYYLIWIVAIILITISINIINSRVGRALRAVHGSEIAAQAMGINTFKYKLKVFILSAVYAGLAGSLYAHFVGFISPSSFTISLSVMLVAMVIIGGMTSIWGAVAGAALLTALPEYLRFLDKYDLLIYAGILMLTMIFMPQGLVPGLSAMFRRIRGLILRRGSVETVGQQVDLLDGGN